MSRAADSQENRAFSGLRPTWLIAGALAPEGWLSPAQRREAAALAAWVERAGRARLIREHLGDAPVPVEAGHEHWLREAAQLAPEETAGACSAWSDGLAPELCEGAWRVDPVHLHLGRDHLVLTDPGELGLDLASARSLAQAIAPVLAEEGLQLQVPVAGRWYLTQSRTQPRARHVDERLDPARNLRPDGLRLLPRTLAAAVGRNIEAYMPAGPDARRWRKLVNEIQMIWFTHPVNEVREAQGLPSVNSLWLEGRCPSRARMLATRPAQVNLDVSLLKAQVEGDPALWCTRWQELWDRIAALEAAGTGAIPEYSIQSHDGATGSSGSDSIHLVLCGDRGWRELEVSKTAPPRPGLWSVALSWLWPNRRRAGGLKVHAGDASTAASRWLEPGRAQ